jgi:hypothetical protein
MALSQPIDDAAATISDNANQQTSRTAHLRDALCIEYIERARARPLLASATGRGVKGLSGYELSICLG